MTMTQKILAAHAGLESVVAGQLIEADLDMVLANDITGPVAIHEVEKLNKKGKGSPDQKQAPPKPRDYFSISYDKQGLPKVSTLVDRDPFNLQERYNELMRE